MRSTADFLRKVNPGMYADVQDWVIENQYAEREGYDSVEGCINHMSGMELLKAYLEWNGIVNMTCGVWDAVDICMKVRQRNG